MKAIILAAGMASRLRPLTLTTPKCLLKIGKYSLLQRSLNALIRNGLNEFIIVTGYLHEKIEEFIRKEYDNSIHVTFLHNNLYETTNNIYSLWLTRGLAEGEDILLLDSDLLYDERIVGEMLSCPSNDAIALIRHELGTEEIKIKTTPNGDILEINKICNPKEALGESLGIEKMGKAYTSALFKELEKMMNVEHLENRFYELAFERLLSQGMSFKVVDVTNYFSCELDTIEDFEHAKEHIPVELYEP